jgi:hypothetical protein
MRKLTKEDRKAYNRYVEHKNEETAKIKTAAPLLAFVSVLIGGFIVMNVNPNDQFFIKVGMGFFVLAGLFLLIGNLAGSGNNNEIMKH